MKLIVDPEARKALDYLIDMALRYDGVNAYRVVSSLEGNIQVYKDLHVTSKDEEPAPKEEKVKDLQSRK